MRATAERGTKSLTLTLTLHSDLPRRKPNPLFTTQQLYCFLSSNSVSLKAFVGPYLWRTISQPVLVLCNRATGACTVEFRYLGPVLHFCYIALNFQCWCGHLDFPKESSRSGVEANHWAIRVTLSSLSFSFPRKIYAKCTKEVGGGLHKRSWSPAQRIRIVCCYGPERILMMVFTGRVLTLPRPLGHRACVLIFV